MTKHSHDSSCGRDCLISDIIHKQEEIHVLQARVKRLEGALAKQPQVVYETLLEATAFMGIPEKKRANFIKERLENVKFIVNKALEEE